MTDPAGELLDDCRDSVPAEWLDADPEQLLDEKDN